MNLPTWVWLDMGAFKEVNQVELQQAQLPSTNRVTEPAPRRPVKTRVRAVGAVVWDRAMAIRLSKPGVDGLSEAVDVLREWQYEGAPMQLHPGDLGWFWRSGAEATAAGVRTWSRDGQILAVGLLDGPGLLRLTIAPDAHQDEELAQQLVEDVTHPERGVLPEGKVNIEAPMGALLQNLLSDDGWNTDEPWTPLRRDLSEPVQDPGVRIVAVGPEQAHEFVAVHRAAWDGSRFTNERWHAMAAGLPYADARCLVAYDHQGNAVAAVTVWSAGRGRPGLLEPMGVHREHRGHGYGKAISVAAAAALQKLGSSSAIVCTPSSNAGAVATYESAGFRQLPEVRDRYRDACPMSCHSAP
ncbi:acetyltransferase [Streptomyces azureus]|uniref:Acetyltransferase n=2 Tax=Streptomyces azureus TaxID=146537 RepID=A0A0K8PZ24_STRAJ|nr:acetyltransferase [Streptomyces azureus]